MKTILFAGTACLAVAAIAAEKLSLDGMWDFRFERGKTLEEVRMPGFVPDDRMVVPGCWDAMSCHYNERGTGCYRRSFELKEAVGEAFLVVDGCALRSRFWIDGREIGSSVMPWIRFDFKTGPLAAGRHEITAAVDSVADDSKVVLFRDFYDFYASGGFHHGVWLETHRSADDIRRVAVRTRDWRTGRVELELRFVSGDLPESFRAEVSFDGGAAKEVEFRKGRAELTVPDPKAWSPESPNLHTVSVSASGRACTVRFGIRQVAVDGGRILLNGTPVYLKGVNRHESHYEFGSSTPVQLVYEDVKNLKALGGNFIRGAHYPQTETFLDLCDELGVMVWEESLGWGNKREQLKDPEFMRLQIEQTRMTVRESINHPCIIVSAFLNEPDSSKPECLELVNRLSETIRAEDTGHLVTFACSHTLTDISHSNTDFIAINTYPCWYNHRMVKGSHDEMRAQIAKCLDDIIGYFRRLRPGDTRPFVVSEIGVKADYGARDPRGKAQYTEDFQAEYEGLMLEEIFKRPEIVGVAIWQFTDSKTYTRTPGMINRSYGVNTGGLYDLYRRPKLVVDTIREKFTEKK